VVSDNTTEKASAGLTVRVGKKIEVHLVQGGLKNNSYRFSFLWRYSSGILPSLT